MVPSQSAVQKASLKSCWQLRIAACRLSLTEQWDSNVLIAASTDPPGGYFSTASSPRNNPHVRDVRRRMLTGSGIAVRLFCRRARQLNVVLYDILLGLHRLHPELSALQTALLTNGG